LHSFDGLTAQWRRFNVPKNEQCPVCVGAKSQA